MDFIDLVTGMLVGVGFVGLGLFVGWTIWGAV